MAKTPAEKQRDYRVRKAAKHEPAKKAGSRITRLLNDHPEKLPQFEAFMVRVNRELKDSQWTTAHPSGLATIVVYSPLWPRPSSLKTRKN